MPASGFGQGSAFAKPGVNSAYALLSRKSAQAKAEAALSLDSDAEREIILSAQAACARLPGEVKSRALRETRSVLSHCRKGHNPETASLLKSCESCNGVQGARSHVFLCRRRYTEAGKRGAGTAERAAADKIWSAINGYSVVCCDALAAMQVRCAQLMPRSRARRSYRHCACMPVVQTFHRLFRVFHF